MSLLHTIALTMIHGIGPATARRLIEQAGDASLLFESHRNLRDLLPDAGEQLAALFANTAPALERAQQELDFIQQKNMRCITWKDADYPNRLHGCDDAPLVLYYCGNADLNARHIVSIVGTRHATPYGRDVCDRLVADLRTFDPSTLIVSGLAYGIDICAHRAALQQGLPTIGVVAHGLDTIYPRVHRQTAVEMTRRGGLLTEYTTHSIIDKKNFVQRNRIVAGMADVTVVVESAERGGSLITARLADHYGRPVAAFPGRVTDEYSRGCNRIIFDGTACAIRSAQDLMDMMGWQSAETAQPQQQELFEELTQSQQQVLDCLSVSDEGRQAGEIAGATGLSFSAVSVALFELEGKGIVEFTGGGRYRRVGLAKG